jgi:hypothetical protein
MKNIALVLVIGAVAFVSGWTIRDQQNPPDLSYMAGHGNDAELAAQQFPEGHPPLLPPGHPPILPKQHPSIREGLGQCPRNLPGRAGPAEDGAYATAPPPGLITT